MLKKLQSSQWYLPISVTLGVAALYVIGGLLVMLPFNGKLTNFFWPPAGFAFASVWWFGRRAISGVILGSLLVSIFISSNYHPGSFIPVAFGIALEACVAVWWLRRQGVSDVFLDAESNLKFILIAILIAPVVAATIGTATLWISGAQSFTAELPTALGQTWLAWWVGDGMGVLLVAPFLLSITHLRKASFSRVNLLELAVIGVLLTWLWLHLFTAPPSQNLPPLSFMAIPLIIWVGVRFNIAVLTAVLFVISIIAIQSTSIGYGPFVRANLHESIAYLYGFLGVVTAIGLFLGVSIAHSRRSMDSLAKQHIALQTSSLHLGEAQRIARLGSWEWDIVADKTTASPECYRIYGSEPSDDGGIAVGYDFVHPEDREFYLDSMARNITYPTIESSMEYRIIRPDGEVRVIYAQGKVTYDENHKPLRAMGTIQDITQLKQDKAEIERLAYYDELTGLPNRRLLLKQLTQSMETALDNKHVALLFVDIDHFKTLNDTHGHETGDLLLKEAAARIRQRLYQEAMVARPGGDEFGIILPGLTGGADSATKYAMEVAEQIRDVLTMPFDFGDHVYHSSASIGAVIYPIAGAQVTLHDMLRQADTALFRAKDAGRNVICFFELHMQDAVNARLVIEQDLREALGKNEFELYLQPQTGESGRIVGAECLLRWRHPKHGLMLPAEFIPVAESTGLIVDIGKWVLHQACTIIARLDAAGQRVRISVNVSPRQFRQHDFVLQVKELLALTGAEPQQLVLEITENVVMENVTEVIARMIELEHMGIGFSIDDFGTGYSSLSYLKHMPLRELKIDKSFIDGLPRNRDDGAIVGSILALARNLGLEVVAEGIETAGQFEYLKAHGCQVFQGYLHGKPIACEELIGTLLAR